MKVKFNTCIGLVCSQEASRYVLENALVFPDGKVLAVDGRMLALSSADVSGQNGAIGVVAGKSTPKSKTALNKGKSITSESKLNGKYPKLTKVIPSFKNAKNYQAVTINASLLLNLARAVNTLDHDGDYNDKVTIVINRRDNEAAIGVIGNEGCGVLMPCLNTSENELGQLQSLHTFTESVETAKLIEQAYDY